MAQVYGNWILPFKYIWKMMNDTLMLYVNAEMFSTWAQILTLGRPTKNPRIWSLVKKEDIARNRYWKIFNLTL